MLVPVRLCDGRLGDVWLLRVVLEIAVWLRGAGHGRWLLDVLGVNGLHARDGLVRRHCGTTREQRGTAKRNVSNKFQEKGRGVQERRSGQP